MGLHSQQPAISGEDGDRGGGEGSSSGSETDGETPSAPHATAGTVATTNRGATAGPGPLSLLDGGVLGHFYRPPPLPVAMSRGGAWAGVRERGRLWGGGGF